MVPSRHFFVLSMILFCHQLKMSESSVNLAVNKATNQSTSWTNHPSSKAVDGYGDCDKGFTHTKEFQQSAWWQVDLGNLYEIKTIQIYYRDENVFLQRLNGYTVNIIGLEPLQTCQCFRDENTGKLPPSLTPSHVCRHLGRYVNMTVERLPNKQYEDYDHRGAVINLCEFEVYGCPKGYYGNKNCQSECSSGCLHTRCDPDNGKCNCTNGWEGDNCETRPCSGNFYGENCNISCPDGCVEPGCKYKNGECLNGCKASFFGSFCNLTCPANCNNTNCDRKNGTCNSCYAGYFGAYCNMSCPENCKEMKCYQYSGHCTECKLQYIGDKCKECVDGYYGETCTPCSEGCKNETDMTMKCDKKNGHCMGSCKDYLFGDFCNNSCPANCKDHRCDKESGNCSDGCKNKYFTGRRCNECINGKYGIDCETKCPSTCNNTECNKPDGSCLSGCKYENMIGKKCESCLDGFFGELCNSTCTDNCQKCNKTTGDCTCDRGKVSGRKCLISETDTKGLLTEDRPSTGLIVGVVVASVVIVLIVSISVLFLKRRRKESGKEKEHENRILHNLSNKEENLKENGTKTKRQISQRDENVQESVMSIEKGNAYSNTADVYMNLNLTEVPISELSSIISTKAAEKEFASEYEKFPKGSIYPTTVGKHPENKIKNRFLTTFPYDHSRIVLKPFSTQQKSDYINANYIDGVEIRYAYIATQGPKENTLFDFWKMVWQEQSGKIVMLTNLIENEKPKCEQYWPDMGHEKDFGVLKVTTKREKEYSFLFERTLLLTNRKTKESRQILQFHFTMWPDHGTPDPVQLMLFHRKVKDAETTLTGPPVVHCAAGIGRTGTFIALDTLHEYGDKTGKIDIFEYVIRMRKNRMNMIQTLDQYIVLHEALLESFQYTGRAMNKSMFLEVCSELNKGMPKNQSHIYKEFQNLTALRPVYGIESYEGALDKENRRKSRNQNILAVEKYRPYLMSQHSSRSNFINAVMLPTFRKKCGYFATHYPLEDTVVDFWCMVFDHDSSTIVVLDAISDKDNVLHWYPTDDIEMNVGLFTIKRVSGPHINGKMREIQFTVTHKDDEKTVRMLTIRPWPTKTCVPPDKTEFLKLIEMARDTASGPVTIVSSDGARCCGLFCTVSNIILNLRIEDDIDIFHTVRQLQIRRPQFITDYEEYKSCYEMVKVFLDSSNVYANV